MFSLIGFYTLFLLDTFPEPLVITLYVPLKDFTVIGCNQQKGVGKRNMNVLSSLDVLLKVKIDSAQHKGFVLITHVTCPTKVTPYTETEGTRSNQP